MSERNYAAGAEREEKVEKGLKVAAEEGEEEAEEIAEGLADLLKKNDVIKRNLTEALNADQSLTKSIDHLSDRISNLNERHGGDITEKALGDLETETANIENRVEDLEAAVENIKAEIQSILDEVDTVSELDESLESHVKELEALESSIENKFR